MTLKEKQLVTKSFLSSKQNKTTKREEKITRNFTLCTREEQNGHCGSAKVELPHQLYQKSTSEKENSLRRK
jgi:hypothetical protein